MESSGGVVDCEAPDGIVDFQSVLVLLILRMAYNSNTLFVIDFTTVLPRDTINTVTWP